MDGGLLGGYDATWAKANTQKPEIHTVLELVQQLGVYFYD